MQTITTAATTIPTIAPVERPFLDDDEDPFLDLELEPEELSCDSSTSPSESASCVGLLVVLRLVEVAPEVAVRIGFRVSDRSILFRVPNILSGVMGNLRIGTA
jgi:hypothetical protein